MVGEDRVAADTVRRIAHAQSRTLREARTLAIRDALMAVEARRRFAGTGRVGSAETSALARALLEQIRRETRAEPVTDEEVAEATARRWQQFDRPPSARTTHAVVLVKDATEEEAALALAQRLAKATADATSSDEFVRRATAVPAGGLTVKAERLPPVTEDGRAVLLGPGAGQPEAKFDLDFSRAANALRAVGEQSPVIRTAFGYHVIRLEERVEAKHLSLEERRSILGDEIRDQRARRSVDELLAEVRQGTSVEISRAADDLTKRVLGRR